MRGGGLLTSPFKDKAMKVIFYILLFISTTGFSQKSFILSNLDGFRVYVDSQWDNRVYLNVEEKLTYSKYTFAVRKYVIESLEPVNNGVIYYIGRNQYCFFNQLTGEGKICEELMQGYRCKEWKNK